MARPQAIERQLDEQQLERQLQDPRGEETHGAVDPKPSPVQVSTERIRELVTTIDTEVRKDWGTTRDTIDDLMRAYQQRGEAIEEAVITYTSEGEQLMQLSSVMREHADKAKKEIGQNRPTTVTAFKPRGG